MIRLLILSLVTVGMGMGCATVPPAYIAADRATFDAVAPEYRIYVQEDAELTQGQKAIRVRTLLDWDKRINAAEAINNE